MVDEEKRGGSNAGGGLNLGDDGADAVAEGGRVVELRAEELELRVHDGRPRRVLGIGGGRGVGRREGADAAQWRKDEKGYTGRKEGGGRRREGGSGGA